MMSWLFCAGQYEAVLHSLSLEGSSRRCLTSSELLAQEGRKEVGVDPGEKKAAGTRLKK